MFKQSAFTLIELLVTVTITAILISVAIVSYSSLFAQQVLQKKAEHLYHFLRLAKSQSVKYNKKVYVHFCSQGGGGKWFMGMSEFAVCDCFTVNSCLLNGSEVIEQMSDGKILFSSAVDITFNGQQVSYSPMRFSVNAGSVVLTDINGYKLKVIQGTMRLRICSPDIKRLGYNKC